MIAVSERWKRIHEQRLLPESFVEISLRVADDTAADRSEYRYWNYSFFGNPGAIIHNKTVLPPAYYATLEENLWLLDGTRQIVSDDNPGDNPGYVSYTNRVWSDEAQMGSRYQITFESARTAITPGLTITWSSEYDEYPTRFTVEALNGDTVIESVTVTGNKSKTSYVDRDFTGYTRLRITPLDWSMPNHKFRIDQIYFGHMLVFDKTNILSYVHEQSGDPLGGELSKNSITFDIDNIDGRWDLLNPDSITRYLCERQSLEVRYGFKIDGDVEWITAGTFYLSEWRLSEDGMKISFTARDIIDFMLNTEYRHTGVTAQVNSDVTIYATPQDRYNRYTHGYEVATLGSIPAGNTVTVYDAVEYWFGSTDLEFMYFIGSGWISAYACGIDYPTAYSQIKTALNESVTIPLSWTYNTRLQSMPLPLTVESTNTANFIQMCAHKGGCTMWQTSDGKLWITSPKRTLTDYVVSGVVEYGQPSMELAKPLKQLVIKTHPRWRVEGMYDGVPQSNEEVYNIGTSGDVITIDNPYLLSTELDDSVDYLVEEYSQWWKHRGMLSGEFRADPRLELFDVISVESKYGMISPVMVTYVKYTYNGSFRGQFEGKILDATLVATTSSANVEEVM